MLLCLIQYFSLLFIAPILLGPHVCLFMGMLYLFGCYLGSLSKGLFKQLAVSYSSLWRWLVGGLFTFDSFYLWDGGLVKCYF